MSARPYETARAAKAVSNISVCESDDTMFFSNSGFTASLLLEVVWVRVCGCGVGLKEAIQTSNTHVMSFLFSCLP